MIFDVRTFIVFFVGERAKKSDRCESLALSMNFNRGYTDQMIDSVLTFI